MTPRHVMPALCIICQSVTGGMALMKTCLTYAQDQDDPAQFSNETCGPAHSISSQAARVAATGHPSSSPSATSAATSHEVQQLAGSKRRSTHTHATLPDPKHPRKLHTSSANGGHVPGQDPLSPSPGARFLGQPVQVNPIDHIFQFHKVLRISSDMHRPENVKMPLALREAAVSCATGKVSCFCVLHI